MRAVDQTFAPTFILTLALTSALTSALLARPALAACPNPEDNLVFSCTIGGKALEICHWKGALIYSFGPGYQPELSLAEPLETIAFTPWPGIGRDIWETVAFPNEGYVYEVWTSAERDPAATAGLRGGVSVLRGEDLVASLTCDPGTPSQSLDVIYALKEAIGQCWDVDARAWTGACN
jgi:hypothetical protein